MILHARFSSNARKERPLPAKNGFTFIELLVVAAIVVVVAGLLLPSLTGAKERGRRTVCLNNMRQLILGLRMYWDDNGDASPAANLSQEMRPEDWVDWRRFFPNPIPNPRNRRFNEVVPGALRPYAAMTRQLLRCPSDLTGAQFWSNPKSFPEWVSKDAQPYPFSYTLSHDGVDCQE